MSTVIALAADARPAEQLPPRAKVGGYVYVVKFSNGTIKVGSTTNPANRLYRHCADAEAFGLSVEDWWISHDTDQYQVIEREVIRSAKRDTGTRTRREYLHGMSFDVVRDAAEQLCRPAVDVEEVEEIDFQDLALRVAAILTRTLGLTLGLRTARVYPLPWVAEYAGLNPTHLRFNCKARMIAHTKIGRRRSMTAAQVEILQTRTAPGGDLHGEAFELPYLLFRAEDKERRMLADDARRAAAQASA
jgi:hypothetical protein